MSGKNYCNNTLTLEEISELNTILSQTKLKIPPHRQSVELSGANYNWLRKNILTKNPDIPNRLKELLNL